jgi:hypothetical protein
MNDILWRLNPCNFDAIEKLTIVFKYPSFILKYPIPFMKTHQFHPKKFVDESSSIIH